MWQPQVVGGLLDILMTALSTATFHFATDLSVAATQTSAPS